MVKIGKKGLQKRNDKKDVDTRIDKIVISELVQQILPKKKKKDLR